MQGDAEANLAHFALQKLHIRPNVLLGLGDANSPMDDKERAFTYASIQVRIEHEKKEAELAKKKGGRK